jgi:hypothetical protein
MVDSGHMSQFLKNSSTVSSHPVYIAKRTWQGKMMAFVQDLQDWVLCTVYVFCKVHSQEYDYKVQLSFYLLLFYGEMNNNPVYMVFLSHNISDYTFSERPRSKSAVYNSDK